MTVTTVLTSDEDDAMGVLTRTPMVVFASTLEAPLPWANSRLVSGDPVERWPR